MIPLPEQLEDSARIAANDCLPNYSKPGTGKTFTTILAMEAMGVERGLIVAPPIAQFMWKDELEARGYSAAILKTGTSRLVGNTNFHITTYSKSYARKQFEQLYTTGGDCLVIDEGHNLKTPSAKRTKAIYGQSGTGRGGLFEKYKQCLTLTGTPIVSHANDLWAQLRATQPDALREHGVLNYEAFLRKFCVTQMRRFNPRMQPTLSVVASRNQDELHSMLHDTIGIVRRTVVENLPDVVYRKIHATLPRSDDFNQLIRGVSVEQMMRDFARNVGDDGMLSVAWRLMGELIAEQTLDYVVESVRTTGPVVVGYWHTSVGDAIEFGLQKALIPTGRVMGSTGTEEREEIRQRFNRGSLDVIVGQMKTMDTAWNLQERGHHVVLAQDHFSPATIEQFIKRVWRRGQAQKVQVDFMWADNALSTAIARLRMAKDATNERVLG